MVRGQEVTIIVMTSRVGEAAKGLNSPIVVEMINRTWCLQGQNTWATNEGTT